MAPVGKTILESAQSGDAVEELAENPFHRKRPLGCNRATRKRRTCVHM